nr:acyl-CoA synthetase [Alphaproteobacteria bacterium]
MTATAKALPPFKPLPMLPPKIYSQRRGDGTYIIRSLYDIGPQHRSIAHLFEERANQHPTRNLLAQRTPQG